MGGGAMRTAAKAAAFAGYRSSAARRPPTLPSTSASSTIHVAIDGEARPLIASISSEKVDGIVSQRPAWQLDGWQLAGGLEEEGTISYLTLDPPPRLVFGPAPSYEEAKEATSDLKEAIEKVYFSTAIADDPIKVSQSTNLGEAGEIIPSAPKHVVQAFSLLHGSSEAQSVVASLASDKNIWEAVMKNDKVMEFCNKRQSAVLSPEESIGENETPAEFSETVESPGETSELSASFADFVRNVKLKFSDVRVKVSDIKVKVSEMVSNISGILQDYMGSSTDSYSETKTEMGSSTSGNYVDIGMGASFIALAVAAILVVLVKRGHF